MERGGKGVGFNNETMLGIMKDAARVLKLV
jgi:hypothetical protein